MFQLSSAIFFLTARCHLVGILVFELSHLFWNPCTWGLQLLLQHVTLDCVHIMAQCIWVPYRALELVMSDTVDKIQLMGYSCWNYKWRDCTLDLNNHHHHHHYHHHNHPHHISSYPYLLDKAGLGKNVAAVLASVKTFKPAWDMNWKIGPIVVFFRCRLDSVKTVKFKSTWWFDSTIRFMLWLCHTVSPVGPVGVVLGDRWNSSHVLPFFVCNVSQTTHPRFHCSLPLCLKAWCHGRWFDRL